MRSSASEGPQWLCLQLSFFAIALLSTLHLIVCLILYLRYERSLTVSHCTGTKLSIERLSDLSKSHSYQVGFSATKSTLYSMFLIPTGCARHYAMPWGRSQEEHHTVTTSSIKGRVSFLSLLDFLTYA